MKVKIFICTLLLLIIMSAGCSSNSKNIYLNDVKINDTFEEVKTKTTGTLYKEESDNLIYDDNLYGYAVKVMYPFTDGVLRDIFFSFTDTYDSNEEYQLKYYKIKEKLIEKFGKRDMVEVQDNCSAWDIKSEEEKYQVLLKMDEKNNITILYSKVK